MRRKVGLAAALLGRPRLLLLDEAMNGLDPESRARLKLELKAFCAGGGTVLFSTHVLETVETLCDRVLILVEGKLRRELAAGEWSAAGPGSLEGLFLGAGAAEDDPVP
jgi:ABC-2 type transport system ATP-binding protein